MAETATLPSSPAPLRVLRKKQVAAKIGTVGRTIDRLERAGQFPKRVQITPFVVGWYEHEIDAWLASRPRAGGSMPAEAVEAKAVEAAKKKKAAAT